MPKSQGFRRKTRKLFRKNPRKRGKLSLSRLLKEYNAGDKVIIKIDSGIHKGMPHRRYQGKMATILNKKGKSYEVNVAQGDSIKKLYVRPEHLQEYKE